MKALVVLVLMHFVIKIALLITLFYWIIFITCPNIQWWQSLLQSLNEWCYTHSHTFEWVRYFTLWWQSQMMAIMTAISDGVILYANLHASLVISDYHHDCHQWWPSLACNVSPLLYPVIAITAGNHSLQSLMTNIFRIFVRSSLIAISDCHQWLQSVIDCNQWLPSVITITEYLNLFLKKKFFWIFNFFIFFLT